MIKIIKEGTRTTQECENCGCLFSYEKEDIKVYSKNNLVYKASEGYMEKGSYIECPQCNKSISLVRVRGTI